MTTKAALWRRVFCFRRPNYKQGALDGQRSKRGLGAKEEGQKKRVCAEKEGVTADGRDTLAWARTAPDKISRQAPLCRAEISSQEFIGRARKQGFQKPEAAYPWRARHEYVLYFITAIQAVNGRYESRFLKTFQPSGNKMKSIRQIAVWLLKPWPLHLFPIFIVLHHSAIVVFPANPEKINQFFRAV